MLLQALYKYATDPGRDLLAELPFQRRTVHLLVPLTPDGSPRGNGFVAVPGTDPKKEKVGREFRLPRFPGEKNNTRAQYLADPAHVVLGVNKDTLEPLAETGKKVPDALHQHRMFWRWAEEADARLAAAGRPDPRLRALLAFRRQHLDAVRRWLVRWTNTKARAPEPEPAAVLAGGGDPFPLAKGNTVGFEVGGRVLADLEQHDPLAADWAVEFGRAFREEVGDPHLGVDRPSLCLVTGTVGGRVAAMHKPEVKIPGTPPKGAAFFSCGSPAFSSYGFADGANAPVSVDAAAAYALAVEDLTRRDRRSSFAVGGVTFCFWAEGAPDAADEMAALIAEASPGSVREFLKSPLAGVARGLTDADQFLSAALSANGGRVMVREWLRVPLAGGVEKLQEWFNDLEIAALAGVRDATDKAGPYALKKFGYAVLPKKPGEKTESPRAARRTAVVCDLYRCALQALPPASGLLAVVLGEFASALVADKPQKRTYPFSQSRFALIKLILARTANGGFRPMPHLSTDTDDAAYNLGRLLCQFAGLQKAAHRGDGKAAKELEGPGIVERYYGAASAAPATVFPVLVKLHQHHLRKLEQKGDKGRRAAAARRSRIAEVVGKFPPAGPGQAPHFPRQLSLEEQGRFALGFYQQMAADQQARRDAATAKKADPK